MTKISMDHPVVKKYVKRYVSQTNSFRIYNLVARLYKLENFEECIRKIDEIYEKEKHTLEECIELSNIKI